LKAAACRACCATRGPARLEDLIALNAMFRPGPMENIPSFCARKNGKEDIVYPHPLLAPVLEETYGIFVYQEQVMQAAQVLGGYSLGGADLLRRAMGKKKAEEMAKHRAIFREGAAGRASALRRPTRSST
jgi:DNA polymerase III subunit alpha